MRKTEFARHLRRNQSRAEGLFWQKIRGRRFCNLKFKRQVPIDKYIADFVCDSEKLIVELDGYQHDDNELYDDERTAVLQSHGFRVFRVRNEDIYADINEVLDSLKLLIGQ